MGERDAPVCSGGPVTGSHEPAVMTFAGTEEPSGVECWTCPVCRITREYC